MSIPNFYHPLRIFVMKKRSLFSLIGATLLVTACGSNEVQPNNAAVALECAFPDAPTIAAPLWVCDAPVDGVEVCAVGIAKKSIGGPAFMKTMAATDGRIRLAQQMQSHVSSMVKQFIQSTGNGSQELIDEANTSVSKVITKETLHGSRVYRTITSPNGSLYALVGISPAMAKQKTAEAITTSINNDKALWQQFLAKKAQDELAAEIAGMQAP
jgi:hypothetical protein